MKLPAFFKRHRKNDDTPYVMGGMAGILAFFILGIFGLSVINHYLLRSVSLASVISAVLVDLTNTDRTTNAIDGLAVNPVLIAAAQAKADDMAAKGYFAHIAPDGKDSWYWFKQNNYQFIYAGENLAVDFSDSLDVERAWMNSPMHRSNILNGHFTEIGIATAQGTYEGRSTTFVVQMFGTPAKKSSPATVRTVSSPSQPTVPAFATTEAPTPTATKVAVTIATGTNLVLGAEAEVSTPSASWWQHLISSPRSVLRYAYYAFAGVILILLAYVTEFEFHRRHIRHVGAAALLFLLMIGLFVLANTVFFATPILAAT